MFETAIYVKAPLDLLTTHSVFWVEFSLALTIFVADDSHNCVGVASTDIAEPTVLAPGQGRLVSGAVNILDPERSGLRLIQVEIRLSFRTQPLFSAHYLQCGNYFINIRTIQFPMSR